MSDTSSHLKRLLAGISCRIKEMMAAIGITMASFRYGGAQVCSTVMLYCTMQNEVLSCETVRGISETYCAPKTFLMEVTDTLTSSSHA